MFFFFFFISYKQPLLQINITVYGIMHVYQLIISLHAWSVLLCICHFET